MAICRAFGVEPFQDSQKVDLPFHFRTIEKGPQCSTVRPSLDGNQGIWLKDGKVLLEMDLWPPTEFRKMEIKKGRDCALILVLNHKTPNQSGHRQLIVLSGFGGVGTEGAAMALVEHYRDLDPRAREGLVWGAIVSATERVHRAGRF
jgi:hypothetical protein